MEIPSLTEVLTDGQWAGRPAILIGGGSSLRGIDWRLLADVREAGFKVLGANMAHMKVPLDVAYVGDKNVVELMQRRSGELGWWRSPPAHKPAVRLLAGCMKPLCDRGALVWEGCHYVYATQDLWGKSLETGIAPGECSRALLSLADILGCSPIFLLGFDFTGEGGMLKNWHDYYPPEWLMPPDDAYDGYVTGLKRQVPERVRLKTVNVPGFGCTKLNGFFCFIPLNVFLTYLSEDQVPKLLGEAKRILHIEEGISDIANRFGQRGARTCPEG